MISDQGWRGDQLKADQQLSNSFVAMTPGRSSLTAPPDGGTRAWLVMIASFFCNGVLFGVINTYSVIYVELQKKLEEQGVLDASSKAGKFCYKVFDLYS